ncbi:DUF5752 family protein [Methylophaga sp. OBS4]|uniref:DUF5752 family protein n=1 Tax=Methylophaga sp. OBS4 TaxID=2991935 RepID=UPI002252B778|nr:DUF5752 family protein [Methylophaga sp. OBS4]MCX4187692.1 DUF5752 family protein [Methylophaga sp. OBS4]
MMVNSDSLSPDHRAPFSIKDCALLTLATGKKARLLQELRRELADIETASIYHHFWGGLLQSHFSEREYNNDFAEWVRHGIHDGVLAEQLSALDPTNFSSLDALRWEIIELIDARFDEVEHLLWTRATQQFEFVKSQIVVFDTERQFKHPKDLASAMMELSLGSIFYHFIDARRRTPDGGDDFSDWLTTFGGEFAPLQEQIASVDPYFDSLSQLRQRLAHVLVSYFQEAAK